MYHGLRLLPVKTGTFYFARNRNFLLYSDTQWVYTVPVQAAKTDILVEDGVSLGSEGDGDGAV